MKSIAPLLKSLLKVILPVLGIITTLKFGFDLGKETEELLENVNKLGEEEGRKASGNGIMDKVALYQYDMQKVNMPIEQIYAEGLLDIGDGIKTAENTSMFSKIFSSLSQINWEELKNGGWWMYLPGSR